MLFDLVCHSFPKRYQPYPSRLHTLSVMTLQCILSTQGRARDDGLFLGTVAELVCSSLSASAVLAYTLNSTSRDRDFSADRDVSVQCIYCLESRGAHAWATR